MYFFLQRFVVLIAIIMLSSTLSIAQKGWWTFDNSTNLTEAVPGHGNDLELTGTHAAIVGPTAGNGAVNIGVGSYYKCTHGIAPNGGGAKVNEYTLLFDFSVSNLGIWHTFYQTNTDVLGDDGEYFKNTDGMLGRWAINYSTTPIAIDTWYRLVITVDLGTSYKTYLDGALLVEHAMQPVDDSRSSLDSVLYFFGDNDGDDNEIDVAEVAIWDYALSEAEVAALGGVGTVIPVELTSFTASQLLGEVTLLWSTATETNNSGFEIERKESLNGWSSIGFVKGNGTTTNAQNYFFTDKPGKAGKYAYRLKQIDFNGTFAYSDIVEVEIIPTVFKLNNNYPNPFNPSTVISYSLPIDAFVTLRIYNSIGEMVNELVNQYQPAGQYDMQFTSYSHGQSLPSGVYFAELKANENVQRIKMMLLK